MVEHHGRFAWYELITTDVADAKAFYAKVVGWGAQDASTPGLPYTLFTAGDASVSGLMGLPDEARRMGATPRSTGSRLLAEPCTSRRRTATSVVSRSSLIRKPPTWLWLRG